MTHTSTGQPELLPCPFCGSAVDLKPSQYGDYQSVICMGETPCEGHLCTVIPSDNLKDGIAAWNRRTPVSQAQRVPASEEAEQAEMYRWLRDHYHGFEHYRTGWAKSLGLFERDIKKQMLITQEKQG